MNGVDIMEFPSRVRPAGHFIYMLAVQVMENSVAVRLESARQIIHIVLVYLYYPPDLSASEGGVVL